MSLEDNSHRAQELGKQAFAQAKEATLTARGAFYTLFADPVGGQEKAIDSLGPKGTIQTGIVFIAAWLLAIALIGLAAGRFLFGMGLGVSVGGTIFSILLAGVIGTLALAVSIWLASRFFGSKRMSVGTTLFTTGVALLPMTLALLLGLLLTLLRLHNLAALIAGAGFVLLVLLINSSLLRVAGMSERMAFVFTPLVILVAGLITRVIS